MNEMLKVEDSLSTDHNQAGELYEDRKLDHSMSFSDTFLRKNSGEAKKSQQKFKSKHFPEPYWGHDD